MTMEWASTGEPEPGRMPDCDHPRRSNYQEGNSMFQQIPKRSVLFVAVIALSPVLAGCQSTGGQPTTFFEGSSLFNAGGQPKRINPAPKANEVPSSTLPSELNMMTMPPYTVAAPDILLIDAQRLVPLPPYNLQPLDVLYLFSPSSYEENPINGPYPIDPDGTINLGLDYGGKLRVADLSTDQIEQVVANRLSELKIKDPEVSASILQTQGTQQIAGEHLVRPDGTVSLGSYGSVYVAGMTLPQIKATIEQHLSQYLYRPQVSVDVYAYNSKFYYVITDFAGAGEQVVKFPSTGNETVLDAVSQIGGLSSVSSKRLWIARPAPNGCGDQILPVDWKGITRRGTTGTNYQLFPGDRLFVMSNPLSKFDTVLARTLAPVQRTLGATLLGVATVRTLQNSNQVGGLGGVGGFGGGIIP